MIFSTDAIGTTVGAAEWVEEVMEYHGVVKNREKDINDALSAGCVGVDLVDGRFWSPPSESLWRQLDAVVDF